MAKLNMRPRKASPHTSQWFGRVCFLNTPSRGLQWVISPKKQSIARYRFADCPGTFIYSFVNQKTYRLNKSKSMIIKAPIWLSEPLLLGCTVFSTRTARRQLHWPMDWPHAHYTTRRGGYGQVFKNMAGSFDQLLIRQDHWWTECEVLCPKASIKLTVQMCSVSAKTCGQCGVVWIMCVKSVFHVLRYWTCWIMLIPWCRMASWNALILKCIGARVNPMQYTAGYVMEADFFATQL